PQTNGSRVKWTRDLYAELVADGTSERRRAALQEDFDRWSPKNSRVIDQWERELADEAEEAPPVEEVPATKSRAKAVGKIQVGIYLSQQTLAHMRKHVMEESLRSGVRVSQSDFIAV